MDIIDTHCHVISPDLEKYPRNPVGGKQSAWAQSRPVTAEQMREQMDQAGIAQSVLVQATTCYGYDNSYVLDSVRRWPDRFIAVGTFDPLPSGAGYRLAEAIGSGLSGVRLFTTGSTVQTQGEWFAAPETDEFWRKAEELAITVCLQLRLGAATEQLISLLERYPRVRVLLDHMGYPAVTDSPADAGAEVAALARHQGLHLKLTHRTLEPLHEPGDRAAEFLQPVIDAFGADRIAWGSNRPAAEQSLPELVQLATDVLAVVSPTDRDQILAGTARSLYPKIGVPAT